MTRSSPTLRLLAGLAVTLLAVGVYSGYTILQLRSLRELQSETIDRNRTDTLLLLRIQNSLNSLGLAMRDMLDSQRTLSADRLAAAVPTDLYGSGRRPGPRREVLAGGPHAGPAPLSGGFVPAVLGMPWTASSRWRAAEAEARAQIRLSLQARQAALSTAVARLLVQNNESEQEAAARTRQLYEGVERNVYIFLAAMLVVIVLTSLYLVHYNRRLFERWPCFRSAAANWRSS